MAESIRIEGSCVHDIPSLYAELGRVLMPDEDWMLGESLDALDDLLYGGFGVLDGNTPATVTWADHERSWAALGMETTRRYYEDKLARPDVYNETTARSALAALDAGTGPLYVELVLQVFAGHPNIELILD